MRGSALSRLRFDSASGRRVVRLAPAYPNATGLSWALSPRILLFEAETQVSSRSRRSLTIIFHEFSVRLQVGVSWVFSFVNDGRILTPFRRHGSSFRRRRVRGHFRVRLWAFFMSAETPERRRRACSGTGEKPRALTPFVAGYRSKLLAIGYSPETAGVC